MTASLLGWTVAVVAWAVAVFYCYRAYRPEDFRFDPRPQHLHDADWLHLTPQWYQFFRLRDMGKTDEANIAYLRRKGTRLRKAMFWTAVEVGALVVAFLAHFG